MHFSFAGVRDVIALCLSSRRHEKSAAQQAVAADGRPVGCRAASHGRRPPLVWLTRVGRRIDTRRRAAAAEPRSVMRPEARVSDTKRCRVKLECTVVGCLLATLSVLQLGCANRPGNPAPPPEVSDISTGVGQYGQEGRSTTHPTFVVQFKTDLDATTEDLDKRQIREVWQHYKPAAAEAGVAWAVVYAVFTDPPKRHQGPNATSWTSQMFLCFHRVLWSWSEAPCHLIFESRPHNKRLQMTAAPLWLPCRVAWPAAADWVVDAHRPPD